MIGPMFGEAWHALGANRLRTVLTMLGMVIGVGAVILMLAVGQGAQSRVEASISSMGSNLLVVLSGAPTAGGVRIGTGGAPTLTLQDADALAELPSVKAVAPNAPGNAQLVHGANNWATQVIGTTPSLLEVRDWPVVSGAPFGESDVRSATRVVLLGQTTAAKLFNDDDPVGQTLRIRGSPFVVAGVLAAKGQSLDGRDQDDTAIIPVTTAQRKVFGGQFQGSVRMILVQAASADQMDRAERQITELLRQRHRIAPGAEDDFSVRNLTAVANAAAETAAVMSMMLGAIASVSLVVGGIGIMNIMLVSVTERTREIGIRLAIGARARDVLMQFLLEAVMLSLIGCLIGALLGVGGSALVAWITDTPVVVTMSSIALSFTVAAMVGVFFGWYPAAKAANMKPIEALRYQ
jgi:putative ABC transport system permease protein